MSMMTVLVPRFATLALRSTCRVLRFPRPSAETTGHYKHQTSHTRNFLATQHKLKKDKGFPSAIQHNIGRFKHTSASIGLNENWDADVRVDMEMFLNKMVPENTPFRHTCEGPDDMPAHIKAAFIGSNLSIPVTDGKLNLGTWQGLWLFEHRNHAGSRSLVLTLQGIPK